MKNYISIIFICAILVSCNNKKNKANVDVSNIKIEKTEIKRLDKDVFIKDPDELKKNISNLNLKYGSFFKIYAKLIQAEDIKDSTFVFKILNFTSNTDIKEIQNECEKEYPNLDYISSQFNNAFKHYKFYYPQNNIPEIITCVNGFKFPFYASDSIIAIGLESYLGSNCRFYKLLQLPKFRTYTMSKEYIIVDCIKALTYKKFEFKYNSNNVLSNMIYEGKIMYFIDAILPEIDDTLKIEFSKKQMDWCINNESKMWSFLIDKKILFSTDSKDINKLINDGPFTSIFNKESPAKTGVWIGWQIVKNFMDKNKNITLQQLMKENDENEILSLSKYKPKR